MKTPYYLYHKNELKPRERRLLTESEAKIYKFSQELTDSRMCLLKSSVHLERLMHSMGLKWNDCEIRHFNEFKDMLK